MVLEYFVLSGIVFLLFIPGVMLLAMVSKKLGWHLSFIDLVLMGSMFWNYLFIVPSVLIGILGNGMISYFIFFLGASMAIPLLYFAGVGKKLYERKLNLKIPSSLRSFRQSQVWIIFVILFSSSIVLVALYTHIILEWDAISFYLPMAKGIVLTGALSYNPIYLSSISMTYPPALPIMYAWVMQISGGDYLRFFPLVYFALTGLVIYQIAKALCGRKYAPIALLVYTSSLYTLVAVGVEGLYLDLAFIFYSSLAVYFIIKGQETGKNFWYLASSMAGGLGLLTKEIGIFYIFFILSLIFFFLARWFRKFLLPIVSLIVFITLEALDIITRIGLPVESYVNLLFRGGPLLIFLFAFSYIAHMADKRLMLSETKPSSLTWISILGLAFLPFLFYLRNLIQLGLITPAWGPLFHHQLGVSEVALVFGTAPDPLRYLQLYNFFLAAALGTMFAVPVIVGLVTVFQRGKLKTSGKSFVLAAWLLMSLMIWSYIFACGYQYGDYRRMYSLLPVLSILVTYGVQTVSRKLKIENHIIYVFMTFNTIALAYIWLLRQQLSDIYSKNIVTATAYDPLFFLAAFYAVFMLSSYLTLRKDRKVLMRRNRFWLSRRVKTYVLVGIIVVNAFLPCYLFLQISNTANVASWNPHYYDTYQTSWDPWTEVFSFYGQSIHDDYVTVTIGFNPFAYFLDRPVIDIASLPGYEPLAPMLRSNDTNAIIGMLLARDIRYFLIPNATYYDQGIYRIYQLLVQKFKLFYLIESDPHFILIHNFTRSLRLYELGDI